MHLALGIFGMPLAFFGPTFGSLWFQLGALELPLAVLWHPFGYSRAPRAALGERLDLSENWTPEYAEVILKKNNIWRNDNTSKLCVEM